MRRRRLLQLLVAAPAALLACPPGSQYVSLRKRSQPGPSSDVLADVEAMAQTIREHGYEPNTLVVGTETWGQLKQITEAELTAAVGASLLTVYLARPPAG